MAASASVVVPSDLAVLRRNWIRPVAPMLLRMDGLHVHAVSKPMSDASSPAGIPTSAAMRTSLARNAGVVLSSRFFTFGR